jgi:hypothetical protein
LWHCLVPTCSWLWFPLEINLCSFAVDSFRNSLLVCPVSWKDRRHDLTRTGERETEKCVFSDMYRMYWKLSSKCAFWNSFWTYLKISKFL